MDCAWPWIRYSVCVTHSCESTGIVVLHVMAHSPAWHCASDPFCQTLYLWIPLLCYENVLCTENFLFIDMQSRLWLDKQPHGFSTLRWWEGKILFDMLARWIFFEMESKIELSCFWTKGKFVLSHERQPTSYCFYLFIIYSFLKVPL